MGELWARLFYGKVFRMAKKREKVTKLQKVKKILGRMLATFIANGLATIGAGTLIGVDIISAVLLAGTLGCVKVAEDIARAYLDDGVLTMDEIDEVFSQFDRRKKT